MASKNYPNEPRGIGKCWSLAANDKHVFFFFSPVPPSANTGKALELLDVFPDVRRESRSAGSIFPVNRQSWKTLLGAGAVLCTSGLCQFPGTSGDLAWLSSQSRYTACLDLCPGAEPRLVNWTGAVSEQLPSVTRE